jgi:hypothetical protein
VHETITITSYCYLRCENCTFIEEGAAPALAKLPQYTNKFVRTNDYALNCLFVVATIANGVGSIEASRLLELLGLPNDTTMETRSFGMIEERLAPTIWSLHEAILFENLKEEVRLSTDESDFVLWEHSISSTNNYKLPTNRYPQLSVSFDTGWNQSSKLYNSPSSPSFMVRKHTQKPVAGEIKSKLCCFCSAWLKKQAKKRQHDRVPT